jgi:hypothetical protein
MISTNTLRIKLSGVVASAWSLQPNQIVPGRSSVPRTAYPHAVVTLDRVDRPFTGARNVTNTYSFEIEGRFAFQEGVLVEDLKAQYADDLGDALLAADWSEVDCYYPRVTSVEFVEDEGEPYYAVALSFSLDSDVTQ